MEEVVRRDHHSGVAQVLVDGRIADVEVVEFDCPGRNWIRLPPDCQGRFTPTFRSKRVVSGAVLPNWARVAICRAGGSSGVKVVNVPFWTPNHTGARAKPPAG